MGDRFTGRVPLPISPRWIEAYYADPALYDFHHRNYHADVKYYTDLAATRPGPLLELGCGSGRLTLPMAAARGSITAVDLSPGLLDGLRRKLAEGDPDAAARVEVIQGDIRSLNLKRKFPTVLLPFNTVMHFYADEDLTQAFACVKRHLAEGGRFHLDLLNPDLAYLAASGGGRRSRMRLNHPVTGEPLLFSENHYYDAARQINYAFHYYRKAGVRGGSGAEEILVLKQRQFFPREMDQWLVNSGFRVIGKYGDFSGGPFSGEAEVMVYVCEAG